MRVSQIDSQFADAKLMWIFRASNLKVDAVLKTMFFSETSEFYNHFDIQ